METKIREFANEMCSVWCRADALYGRWAVQKHINYFVLLVLWVLQINSGGMTQKKISQYYGWPKQTTNSAIRTLKQEGMILLLPETADKWEKKVILSEKGEQYAKEVLTPLFRLEDRVFGNIQEERLQEMMNTIKLFITLFEKELEQESYEGI